MTDEQVAIDIATIKATLESMNRELIGNGQPGRIGKLETRMALVEDFEAKAKGVIAFLAFVITAVGTFLGKHLSGR